jgi:2-iminobutanoate/2-iminopropanoate deaminase
MSLILRNPPEIAAPVGRYTHVVEAPPGLRWVHLSGQVGMRPDGTLGGDFAEQAEIACRNVLAGVASAGMTVGAIVKLTVFLTRREDIPAYREIRGRVLGAAAPASTLLLVAGLAHPDWLIEVEAIAAAA